MEKNIGMLLISHSGHSGNEWLTELRCSKFLELQGVELKRRVRANKNHGNINKKKELVVDYSTMIKGVKLG